MRRNKLLTLIGSVCLILVLATLPFMTACPAPPPAETLKIGYLTGLSGYGSEGLRIWWQGAQIARDIVNEQGGITINGQQYLLELIVEDTAGDPDTTIAKANKLVYEEKVKFISGPVMPHIVAAAGTVTEPAGVLLAVVYNCYLPFEYGPDTPYTFVCNNASVEGIIAMMTFMGEEFPEIKDIVWLGTDDGTIPYLTEVFEPLIEKYGVTLLETIVWPLDIVDFAPLVTRALAHDPDAIVLGNGWPESHGSILKIARESGYTKPVIAWDYVAAEDVREVAGPGASSGYYVEGITVGDPSNPPMTKKIAEMAIAKYGEARTFHFMGFGGVYSLAQAIEEAQSIDPIEVRYAWEKMETIETAFGTGRMAGLETYGIKHTVCSPMAVQALVDGELKHIKWIEVYSP